MTAGDRELSEPAPEGARGGGYLGPAAARAYADYFDEFVDELPRHQREAVWRGELDITEFENWHPPIVGELA